MIILFLCIGLPVGFGFLANYFDQSNHEALCITTWMLTGILGIVAIVILCTLIFNPLSVKADIAQFKSVEQTLLIARANPNISPLELAAIQQKVAEMNEWLASSQFWAKKFFFKDFWPKSILTLQPIR